MRKIHVISCFMALSLMSSCGFIKDDLDVFVEANGYKPKVDVIIDEITPHTVNVTIKPSANTSRYDYGVKSWNLKVGYGSYVNEFKIKDLKANTSYVLYVAVESVLGEKASYEYPFTTKNDVEVKATSPSQFYGNWRLTGTNKYGESVVSNSNNVYIYQYLSDPFDVIIEGLMDGKDYYYALGDFNEGRGVIDIWGGWGFKAQRTFTLPGEEETSYARFYPVSGGYFLNPVDDRERIISMSLNKDGSISFVGDSVADWFDCYADGFCFRYFKADDGSYNGLSASVYNVKLTKK